MKKERAAGVKMLEDGNIGLAKRFQAAELHVGATGTD